MGRRKRPETKEIECKFCGKKFTPTDNYGRLYCSDDCKRKAINKKERDKYRKTKKKATTCAVCGKKLGRGKKWYCSIDCKNKANGRNTKPPKRTCKSCGKKFQPTRGSNRSYCSPECIKKGTLQNNRKWQRKNRKYQNKRARNEGECDTICICPRCGKTHVKFFFWTGRGTPRKYCQLCEHAVNFQDSLRMAGLAYEHEITSRSARAKLSTNNKVEDYEETSDMP